MAGNSRRVRSTLNPSGQKTLNLQICNAALKHWQVKDSIRGWDQPRGSQPPIKCMEAWKRSIHLDADVFGEIDYVGLHR